MSELRYRRPEAPWRPVERVEDMPLSEVRERLEFFACNDRRRLSRLKADIRRLLRSDDRQRRALLRAWTWFGDYASEHERKGAAEKAFRNRERARECRAATGAQPE